MKRCLACEAFFEAADWTCPKCGYQPALCDEIYQFTEGAPDSHAGFKPEYFARLADIEDSNFWFRARNELIQWALRDKFPDANSFFEVGCGTGFVLAGIHEKFPRMRLAGSEIFVDGLAIAKTRVPTSELYQMDARRISFEREFDVVGAFDVLEHV
ncbi:MAG TPA: class I SAM-dependent methyltransferase, partial [Candidatus Udaeobacter sp.]|nr:class I SAM-dependent methyltransferase [Candidatus Udaeobacter sp.]